MSVIGNTIIFVILTGWETYQMVIDTIFCKKQLSGEFEQCVNILLGDSNKITPLVIGIMGIIFSIIIYHVLQNRHVDNIQKESTK